MIAQDGKMMTPEEMMEKIKEFEAQGWTYIHNGRDWTSGVWYHDHFGCVNNGGGAFSHIREAVMRLEKFLENIEKINQS